MSITVAPTLTTSYVYDRRDMPTLDLPDLDDGDDYTTPSITVPANSANPYILRDVNPSGTVFIAVGAIVGAILLGFVLFHLINSLTASRLAKKAFFNDKQMYEKYQNNNNTAYGISPSTTLDFGGGGQGHNHSHSVTKLPLLSSQGTKSMTGLGGGVGGAGGSQFGDTSTLYQSEIGGTAATSKHDLTKMFVSPTAEVMSHNVNKPSHINNSVPDLSYLGSSTNLSTNTDRNSTIIPNLYMNNAINNSDYHITDNSRPPLLASRSLSPSHASHPQGIQGPPEHLQHLNMNSNADHHLNVKPNRRTIPSMYLEDLIDE